MSLTFDELKDATNEALIISTVKLLVFKQLKNKYDLTDDVAKNKVNSKPNKFYKPGESDMSTQSNFNRFIEKLSESLL